jgi:hypothetical protein
MQFTEGPNYEPDKLDGCSVGDTVTIGDATGKVTYEVIKPYFPQSVHSQLKTKLAREVSSHELAGHLVAEGYIKPNSLN